MKDWLKGIGKAALDAGKAKIDDTRDRLAEPALTPAERSSYDRFRVLGPDFLAQSVREGLPPCPASASKLNLREIRAVLAHPVFPHALAAGEKAAAEAAAAAAEDARRAEAARVAEERRQAQEKLATIDAFYANELNPVVVQLSAVRECLTDRDVSMFRSNYLAMVQDKVGRPPPPQNLIGVGLSIGDAIGTKLGVEVESAFNGPFYSCTLRDFPSGQRAMLRLAEVLAALGQMTRQEAIAVHTALVWNEGKTAIQGLPDKFGNVREKKLFLDAFNEFLDTHFGGPEVAAEKVQDRCRKLLEASDTPAEVRDAMMKHLYSGARWLTASAAAPLAEKGESATALRLGTFVDGSGELLYDRDAPLFTIAQPGSGKSQAHALRNLLTMKAPAVVLDVKDRELFEGSAGWRSREVGPCYKFDPLDPAGSIRFNPLDFISDADEETAYEDAGKVAELLTVPPDGKDYFDTRAHQIIMAAVLDVALREPPERRNMQAVLDRVSGVDTHDADATKDFFQDFVAELQMSDLAPLRRVGKSLVKMVGSDQLLGVMDTAVTALNAWEAPRIARLTNSTTFNPASLRGENATLYLCVNVNDVKRYAGVLRTIIGLTMGRLCLRRATPEDITVTFILDEMPRLRRMDVIEEGSDTVRGYKVRLWIFAQNEGQIEAEYPNAKGLLSNCLARCYLSPDENTARWLSENIGMKEGLLDGERRPLVEASELTGPEYRDRLIVMLNGFDNARLNKVLADKTPELMERMGIPLQAEAAE